MNTAVVCIALLAMIRTGEFAGDEFDCSEESLCSDKDKDYYGSLSENLRCYRISPKEQRLCGLAPQLVKHKLFYNLCDVLKEECERRYKYDYTVVRRHNCPDHPATVRPV